MFTSIPYAKIKVTALHSSQDKLPRQTEINALTNILFPLGL